MKYDNGQEISVGDIVRINVPDYNYFDDFIKTGNLAIVKGFDYDSEEYPVHLNVIVLRNPIGRYSHKYGTNQDCKPHMIDLLKRGYMYPPRIWTGLTNIEDK